MSTGGAAAREMPIIHRIFRRQFAEVRALVQEVPTADATRVGAIADHLGFLLDGLHMHHTTEDDLIWPKLLDRAGLDAPRVERMEEQHRRIDVSVAEVRTAMSAWRSALTPPRPRRSVNGSASSSSSPKGTSTRRSRSSCR